jgi:CRISPR-associated protein Csb2
MKLLIAVNFLCRHYHGRNREKTLEDFPPSPMRLFQALIAASHRGSYGRQNVEARDNALRWLENLVPPVIVADETVTSGEDTINFVPNNDSKLDHIRTDKSLHHHALLGDSEVRYIWDFDANESATQHAKAVCAMAELVTYLGQTTDLVIAHGKVVEDFEVSEPDAISFEPRENRKGDWQSPAKGTLKGCQVRFDERLNSSSGFPVPTRWVDYKKRNALYLDAPKVLFELRRFDGKRLSYEASLLRYPSAMTRHAFLEFLKEHQDFTDETKGYNADLLSQKFAGYESSTSVKPVKAPHVAFVPLPSLNSDFTANGRFARVLVIGYGCENDSDREMFYDIAHKLNGRPLIDEQSRKPEGELRQINIDDDKIAYRFIVKGNRSAKTWRTVTPIVLSGHTKLITSYDNPHNEKVKVFKKGYSPEELILKSLREAGVPLEAVESVAASKSPLVPKTQHAFYYKPNIYLEGSPRYHAEIVFKQPIIGSLVIGRGRYTGFGLMIPWR